MKIEYAGLSSQGRRTRNEDALLMRSSSHAALFLVADGIGGHRYGKETSGMIRDGYANWWERQFLPAEQELSFSEAVERLEMEIQRVNNEIFTRFGEFLSGSTLVLLFFFRGQYACFSAGDSRIYQIRKFSVTQITRDDTAENLQPLLAGTRDGRKLLCAIGIRSRLNFSEVTASLHPADRYLLCSDGVYRFIRHGKLCRLLLFGGLFLKPEKLIEKIAAEVEKGGAGDNYTMIAVTVYNLSGSTAGKENGGAKHHAG